MHKRCTKCGESKEYSQFQIRRASKDGLTSACKHCLSIYDKQRANLPHRVSARKNYQKTDKGKEAIKRSHQNFIKKFPEKRKAHVLVDNYIRDGKLIRPKFCEKCNCECTPKRITTTIQSHLKLHGYVLNAIQNGIKITNLFTKIKPLSAVF